MPRLTTRILLFLSSYAPLFLILGYDAYPGSWILASIFSTVGFVSFLGLWGYVCYWLPTKTKLLITAKRVDPQDSEAVSYLVFYLFPFLDVNLQSLGESFPMIILLIVMATIYVNSNMMYVNPSLNLMGFHIFEVEDENGNTYGMISKSKYIRPGTSMEIYPAQNYIALKDE